jgi:hypothetical protein
MWQQILIGAVGAVGVPAFLFVVGLFLKPKTVHSWGTAMGSALTLFGQKRVGRDNWEKIENWMSGTVNDLCQGILEGLNADDAEVEKK